MRSLKNVPRITHGELEAMVAGRSDAEIGQLVRGLLAAGRPRKALDIDKIVMLRSVGCSIAEIAATLRVDEKTIDRRKKSDPVFARLFDTGRHVGNLRLRSAQYHAAVNEKNPTMLIWLGKQSADGPGIGLGQRDTQTLDAGENKKICITISQDDSML